MAHIVIVGGSVSGLVSALMLSRMGHVVEIHERQGDPRNAAGHSLASVNVTLSERGLKSFDQLGLRALILSSAIPVRGRMIHFQDSHATSQDYGASAQQLYCASRLTLTRQLVEEAEKDTNIALHFESECTAVDTKSRTVTFTHVTTSQSHTIVYDHLIGADGTRSRLRSLLTANGLISETVQPSPFHFVEFNIRSTVHGTSPLDTHFLHVWPRTNYFVIAFPNADHSCTGAIFVRSVHGSDVASIFDLLPARQLHHELPELETLMPEFLEVLRSKTPRRLFQVHCSPWAIDDSLLLLGDSAHTILPFLGQGMNSSLEDCARLMGLITEKKNNWSSAITAFQKERIPDIRAIDHLALLHFENLASVLASDDRHSRLEIEAHLAKQFPTKFVTPYQLIEFSSLPYALCERIDSEYTSLMRMLQTEGDSLQWDCPDLLARIEKRLDKIQSLRLGSAGNASFAQASA